jgi:stage II sporulation protein R
MNKNILIIHKEIERMIFFMKKIIIFILTIVTLFSVITNIKAKESIIRDNTIRFRILANSNSIYDQNIKIQVRNVIQNEILKLVKDCNNKEETRKVLINNKIHLEELTRKTLNELNYDKDFEINYGYNYFPKKKYNNNIYKEGKYESLVIKLGEGKGDNFWCILFPPLCLLESEDNSNTKYSFYLKDLYKKIVK